MRKSLKNNKGITLIALVVTIIILLILSSIAVYSGVNTIKSAKFKAFQTELLIMETEVDSLYQKYKDNGIVELKQGENYTGEEILTMRTEFDGERCTNIYLAGYTVRNNAQKAFSYLGLDGNGYIYFNKYLIEDLGIEGLTREFFVNIAERSVISCKGFDYNGQTYYTLDQMPDSLYKVNYQKMEGKPTFECNQEVVNENKNKIIISNV
ncbi:MAG: hypothetical protein J6O41_05420, partial [Clostridia bacterium]|nr:hypothetical protein [Clostridia bacterium]